MFFPDFRPRRMRANENLRRMIREATLSTDDLIMPLFVKEGQRGKKAISSMPGNFQMGVEELAKEVQQIEKLGIPAVLLFGIPKKKDSVGSGAYDDDGIVQRAIRAIRKKAKDIVVITDVCLCEYTDHGHCGVLRPPRTAGRKAKREEMIVDNDETLDLLSEMALSHARAGANMIAPSDMMDGRVGAIRSRLDDEGYEDVPIMAYTAKYASSFYGPFREAGESPPKFGDRRSYQMDPPNSDEALREAQMDIDEGADIIMVKPALAYMDIIFRIKTEFDYPVAAYNVSGEFAMVKAAAAKGWIDEKQVVLEILTGLKRAGADMILTYHAKDAALWLR